MKRGNARRNAYGIGARKVGGKAAAEAAAAASTTTISDEKSLVDFLLSSFFLSLSKLKKKKLKTTQNGINAALPTASSARRAVVAALPRRAADADASPSPSSPSSPSPSSPSSPTAPSSSSRRGVLASSGVLSAAVAASSLVQLSAAAPRASAGTVVAPDWEQVPLPLDPGVVLLDIGFTGTDPHHGFLLGSRETLLETNDGGRTWAARTLGAAADEGFNYRFNSISFNGDEGLDRGQARDPAAHDRRRRQLGARPPVRQAPGHARADQGPARHKPGQAEMTTDQGAVYVTDNAAYTWTAAVQETVDATLNRTVSSGISRRFLLRGLVLQRGPLRGHGRIRRRLFEGQLLHDLGTRADLLAAAQQADREAHPEHGLGPRRQEAVAFDSRRRRLLRVARRRTSSTRPSSVPAGSASWTSGSGGRLGRRFRVRRVRARCSAPKTAASRGSATGLPTRWRATCTPSSSTRDGSGFILGNDGILLRYISG